MTGWSALFGAMVGWVIGGFEGWAFVLGGIAGAIGGWGLRRGVRQELAAERSQLEAWVDARLATLAEPMPAPPPAIAPQPVVAPPPEPVFQEQVFSAPPQDFTPPPPREPAEPGIVEQAFAAARGWLFGGNTVVRVGLVILFVGLSFLASYAASAGLFPVELRLALVAAVGIALLGVGYRTREARPGFGLALQGGGVAAIYLALFGAAKLIEGFPILAAFALMVLVCALGCALALLQRSQALAVTAFAGGFATPLLLSTGGGEPAGLFGYYTILNLAILFIAARRAWRGLNLLGFFATFAVASLWMADGYTSADFTVTQAFVAASVLIYLATAVLYTRATPGRMGAVVDTTLLFGPALAGFGLEVALVGDRPFGSAFAALGFAAAYLATAAFTMRRRPDSVRIMAEAMLAIGVGFVTLAVPLALGAHWTSAAWALEGAGAFWVGMRQARWLPRLFGLGLQLVAAVLFLGATQANVAAAPFANPAFTGAMLIALAALATAWWLRRELAVGGSRWGERYLKVERRFGIPAFLIGFGFFWLAWMFEAGRSAPTEDGFAPVFAEGMRVLLAILAYLASAWAFQAIARRHAWPVARWPSYASLLALLTGLVGALGAGRHVLSHPDWMVWLAAVGLHLHMLYRNDRAPGGAARLVAAAHVGGVWLGTAMLADMLWMGVDAGRLWDTSWAGVVFLASVTAVLILLTGWATRAMEERAGRWPLDMHAVEYGWVAAAPVAGLTAAGALITALGASGRADPLPYIPLLNPVDLTVALALAALLLWRRAVLRAEPAGAQALRGPGSLASLAALAFVALNTAWLRAVHQLEGVAWNGEALMDSTTVQTGLAIGWTLLALPLMVVAHRRLSRALWLVGAGLLGLAVVKLLLVDLNSAGGGARIVAFIGVGALMLVVGYLAPIPPREREA